MVHKHALAIVKRNHGYQDGQPYVGTFDERVPEYRNTLLAVNVADDGDDVTHTQLLGLGQDLAPDEWPVLLPSVQQAVQDYPEMWHDHFWQSSSGAVLHYQVQKGPSYGW
ncbi:TPA: hypothetical protein ACH3X1_010891 [Trebouxia sp. C0004]